MKQFSILLSLALMVCASLAANAGETDDIAATVEAFHNALAHGEGAAAMKLLAPDAVILESGFVETRSEYERHHLPEDIRFAQAVRSTRFDVQVEISGDTAWLTSRSRSEGEAVNREGVELAVLIRTPNGWRIRAIHWSSHKAR